MALWNLQHTIGLYSPTRLWHTQHYSSYSVYGLLVVTTILQRFSGFADVFRRHLLGEQEAYLQAIMCKPNDVPFRSRKQVVGPFLAIGEGW